MYEDDNYYVVCKRCGKKIYTDYSAALKEPWKQCYKNRGWELSQVYHDSYKNNKGMFICPDCQEPIPCDDMPLEMFLFWLNYTSKFGKDDHKTLGEAVANYFKLDEIIKEKFEDYKK